MTTTGYPIVLPTSPEVRERLKAAGFSLDAETFSELSPDAKVIGETWIGPVFDLWLRAPNGAAAEMHGGDCIQLAYFLAVANILGIQTPPPGMRLVPDETVKGAMRICENLRNLLGDTTPLITATESALATTLSGDNQKGAPAVVLTPEQTAGRAEVLRLMRKSVERWPYGEMTPNIQEWIQLLDGTADWFKPQAGARSKEWEAEAT